MAGEGEVIACHSVKSWKEQLEKGKECKKLIVVDFTATWCGPCRAIGPIMEEVAKKTKNVLFLKVDVDELMTVAEEWNVEAMPTFIFLKDGKMIDKLVGASKEGLHQKIAKHA